MRFVWVRRFFDPLLGYKSHNIRLFSMPLRQIRRAFFRFVAISGECRNDSERKTSYFLEWAENRRNFASSIRQNNVL